MVDVVSETVSETQSELPTPAVSHSSKAVNANDEIARHFEEFRTFDAKQSAAPQPAATKRALQRYDAPLPPVQAAVSANAGVDTISPALKRAK